MQWPLAPDEAGFTSTTVPYPAGNGGEYGAARDGGRTHKGYDFPAPRNWRVRAIADGRIYYRPPYIDNGDHSRPTDWADGGHQVWIQHNGFMSRYLHLEYYSPNQALPIVDSAAERPIYYGGQGQFVKQGDIIGTVGGSGATSNRDYADHLHLEIVLGTPGLTNNGINPIPYIKNRLTTPAPAPTVLEDDMISIHAPNRGVAVIGPGYYKSLTPEEASNVAAIVTKSIDGNDRQFDVWKAIALQGTRAA